MSIRISLAQSTDNVILPAAGGYIGVLGAGNTLASAQDNASSPQDSTILGGEGGTLSKFRVAVEDAPGAGTTWTFTLQKNKVATAVVLTITGTATTASDLTSTVTVSAGDVVCWAVTATNSPTRKAMRSSCLYECTNPFFTTNVSLSTVSARSFQAHAEVAVLNSSMVDFDRLKIPVAGTLKNFYVRLSTAPGAGKTVTILIVRRRGAANTTVATLTVTGDTATTASDLVSTDSIQAGDYIFCQSSMTADSTIPNACKICMDFVPATASQLWYFSRPDDAATGAGRYPWLSGGCLTAPHGLTEFQGGYVFSSKCTLSNLYIEVESAPGASTALTWLVQKNGVATEITVTIAGTDTTGSDTTHEVEVSDGDVITILQTESVGNPPDKDWFIYILSVGATVYPSVGTIRVTGIRHVYRQGSYRLEATIGDVSVDVKIPEAPPYEPAPFVEPAYPPSPPKIEPYEVFRGETPKEQLRFFSPELLPALMEETTPTGEVKVTSFFQPVIDFFRRMFGW